MLVVKHTKKYHIITRTWKMKHFYSVIMLEVEDILKSQSSYRNYNYTEVYIIIYAESTFLGGQQCLVQLVFLESLEIR